MSPLDLVPDDWKEWARTGACWVGGTLAVEGLVYCVVHIARLLGH